MKYVVQGQNINSVYKVSVKRNDEGKVCEMPKFQPNTNVEWENCLSFECDHLEYNNYYTSGFPINISENEEVKILGQIFRADEQTTYLRTNKVLSETEDKETNYIEYQEAVNEYIEYVFEKYPEVKEHCKIYNITGENLFDNIEIIKNKVLKEDEIKELNDISISLANLAESCSTMCNS